MKIKINWMSMIIFIKHYRSHDKNKDYINLLSCIVLAIYSLFFFLSRLANKNIKLLGLKKTPPNDEYSLPLYCRCRWGYRNGTLVDWYILYLLDDVNVTNKNLTCNNRIINLSTTFFYFTFLSISLPFTFYFFFFFVLCT